MIRIFTFRLSVLFLTALFLSGLVLSPQAKAQAMARSAASQTAQQYAIAVAKTCLADWTTPNCLSMMSSSNLVLVSNYGAALQSKGLTQDAEALKQFCAASTAARQQPYPAYAMLSAFKDCANVMSDVAKKTGVQPDASHYQLLVGAVLCLSGDANCASVSAGLQPYARLKLPRTFQPG